MKLDDALQAVVPTARALPGAAATDMSPDAWRREMERQQAETWFQGPLALSDSGRLPAASSGSNAGVSSGSARPASPPARTDAHSPATRGKASASAQPNRTASERAAFDDHRRSAQQVPARGTAVPAAGGMSNQAIADGAVLDVAANPVSPSLPRFVLASGFAANSAESDAPQPPERAAAKLPQSQESQAAVRVHVEGDAKAATVWLGVDASALAELPSLTQTIARWLTRQGYGAPTWICNGQTLTEPVPTHAAARQQQPGGPVPHFVIEPSTGESA
jgi:hypothetical protein